MVTPRPAPRFTLTRRDSLAVIAIALTAILLRIPYLSWPITMDEAGYSLGADWWARGVAMYSRDLWFDRPQGIFVAYGLGAALFGDSVAAIRIWGGIWLAGGAVAVWALGRGLLDARKAIAAGLLTALVFAAPMIEGFTSNAEAFMVPAATLSAVLVWRGTYGWAGLIAGIAVLLKPSGASALALGIAWIVYTGGSRRSVLLFVAAAFAPIAAAFAHGWATVGAWQYLEAAVLFRVTHPVGDQVQRIVASLAVSGPVMIPLLAFGIAGGRFIEGRARTFWLLWLLASLGGVAMGGGWRLHYYLQLVPPLALSYGAALGAIRGSRPPAAIMGWALGVVLIVGSSVARVAAGPVPSIEGVFGPGAGILVAEDVGIYLRERTVPSDRIYVAFTAPGINYFAQRLSSEPWLYAQPLGFVEGAYGEVLASARSGVPRYIVIMQNRPSHEGNAVELLEAMGDRYEFDRQFDRGSDGAAVYRRR